MKILDVPQSGSVAGVTASRNRFGQYRRTRAIPVQPRTPKQTANRGLFTSGSAAWRALSDAQRTAWNDYAAQITRSDRLGSGYSPTGASLYTGSATAFGGTLAVEEPPGNLPSWVLLVTGMTYTGPAPGPEAFTYDVDSTSPDNEVLVETSGPVSPGITSAAAVRRWRSLPTSALNLAPRRFTFSASPVSILANYNFLFPSPIAGQVIWFRFREVFNDGSIIAPIVNKQAQTFRFIAL